MRSDDRDRQEAYEAYLESQHDCDGCLHDRGRCTHPSREVWKPRRAHGQTILTACAYLNIVESAERIAASA